MAEPITTFVTHRRPDWEALKELLSRHRAQKLRLEDLSELDKLYRRATADLAHAQAQYPGTQAHRFLNQLCADAYGAIYQPPRDRLGAIRRFFGSELPQTLRRSGRYVAASAFLFLLSSALGALVVWFEPRGAELLVPEAIRDAVARRE